MRNTVLHPAFHPAFHLALRLAVVLLAALASTTAVAQSGAGRGSVDLRPKFITGQETKYKMEISSNGVTESPDISADPSATPNSKGMGTIKSTQKMSQSVGLRFKVINVDANKNATVELIYDSLKVAIDGPEGKVDFDSSSAANGKSPTKPAKPSKTQVPATPPIDSAQAANLAKVVGSKLTLVIDKDGNITSVSGGEGLVPSSPDDPSSTLTTPSGVKELWGPIFTMRKSSGSATVGETWKTSDTMDASPIGRFTITTDSVLKSVAGSTANVEFKGLITPAVESAGAVGGFQVKDSSHNGTYQWDTEHGVLRTLNMTQIVNIEAGMQGFQINSKSTTKTSVTRVE